MTAARVKSDLELPPALAKFLSPYLLFAIGFKGGVALAESELDAEAWQILATAVVLAGVLPVFVFYVLRRWLDAANGAAVAAT